MSYDVQQMKMQSCSKLFRCCTPQKHTNYKKNHMLKFRRKKPGHCHPTDALLKRTKTLIKMPCDHPYVGGGGVKMTCLTIYHDEKKDKNVSMPSEQYLKIVKFAMLSIIKCHALNNKNFMLLVVEKP